jgi:hypothetical protein
LLAVVRQHEIGRYAVPKATDYPFFEIPAPCDRLEVNHMPTAIFHDRLIVQHFKVILKRIRNQLTKYPDPGIAGLLMPAPLHEPANERQYFRMRTVETVPPYVENAVLDLDGSAEATDFPGSFQHDCATPITVSER